MAGPPLIPAAALHLAEAVPPFVVCFVYLALYGKRASTLARERRPVPSWRIASFISGVVLMTAVQLPPLDDLCDEVFVAHMVQHIVIGDFAAILIVFGVTGPVIQPLLHMRATRPLRVLATPILALALWALDLYAWHIPFFYQAAIRHDLVHALEHAMMLWFGVLLWMALFGPLPKPRWFEGWGALVYVIGVRLTGAVLANVLIWSQTVFYPVYRSTDAARGLGALSDQNLAGGVMMVEESLLTVMLLAWLFYRFAKQDEERQELVDLAAERGIALTDERALRAARAGRAGLLRERLLAGAPIDSAAVGSDRGDGDGNPA